MRIGRVVWTAAAMHPGSMLNADVWIEGNESLRSRIYQADRRIIWAALAEKILHLQYENRKTKR